MTLARRKSRNTPAVRDDGDGGGLVTESALSRFAGWVMVAPARRAPLASAIPVWAVALAVHAVARLAHVTAAAAVVAGLLTLAGALSAGWLGEHRAARSEHPRLAGAELAAATAVVGGWFAVAVAAGPLGAGALADPGVRDRHRRRVLVAATPSRGPRGRTAP